MALAMKCCKSEIRSPKSEKDSTEIRMTKFEIRVNVQISNAQNEEAEKCRRV
jgi:hypothetical protein